MYNWYIWYRKKLYNCVVVRKRQNVGKPCRVTKTLKLYKNITNSHRNDSWVTNHFVSIKIHSKLNCIYRLWEKIWFPMPGLSTLLYIKQLFKELIAFLYYDSEVLTSLKLLCEKIKWRNDFSITASVRFCESFVSLLFVIILVLR